MNPLPRRLLHTIMLMLLIALPATRIPVAAFTPPQDTQGPLTVEIADPGEVTKLEQPMPVAVTLINAGDAPLMGTVRLAVTDEWRVEKNPVQSFTLAPTSTQKLNFTVVAGKGVYAALYPIHAFAEFRVGNPPAATAPTVMAHAILIASVSPQAVASPDFTPTKLPVLTPPQRGSLRLDVPNIFQTSFFVNNKAPVTKSVGWQGSDAETGTSVSVQEVERGERRRAIGVHPPWRTGWGDTMIDYRVALPNQKPIMLEFATAIRDHNPEREGGSDGVQFRVLVGDGGDFKQIFDRFSDAKRWEPAQVDLSAYAGREVTLRLQTGPGPAHNTSSDQSYWATPTLTVGPQLEPEPEAQKATRRTQALQAAKTAVNGQPSDWSWKLTSEAATMGAALVPGPNGIADAIFALADANRALVFDGFTVEIDGQRVGGKAGLISDKVERRFANGRGVLTHHVPKGDRMVPVQTEVWAEKGALRLRFSMPGVTRDLRGQPRFTSLLIGPASEKARRVYAGFGNVIQDPGRFDLNAGGFNLSTRHVGADFENGLSLVQATDIFPDSFSVNPETRRYALVAHHDATFSFVPSSRGAFAAARVYRAIADFKPAGGVATILGKMCLDQWGGDYREAAEGVEKAARYGLADAVFVKHVWQRWGYDYRLPEIYPPSDNFDDFMAMVDACKRHGILFCPHDNYIDFYPDAKGFSYNHIIFNPDGTPQKAWFNKGRQAQSYRWLPTAFFPWLDENLKLVKQGFAPTSYFVDVFSAIPPVDFYDRQGRFYPKSVTAERWGAAFDRIREVLGNNAPTISEAGHDGLIGHLDAAQSDHSAWIPKSVPRGAGDSGYFRWDMDAADAERTPWHDMATHGSFVLLAGGLGNRYSSGRDQMLYGYGSDDYLSLTVLGGRNPMCDGPFSRRAVMTYWLLHDLCAQLARGEMLAHEFAGDDIHRQTVRFSNDAFAHVNRGQSDWQIEGRTLPPYGFVARAGDHTVDVTRRDGIISAFAQSPLVIFVDARPAVTDAGRVRPRVVSVEDLGNRKLRLKIEWDVQQPVLAGYRPFLHFVDEKAAEQEGIAFQGGLNLDMAKLAQPGTYTSVAEITVPETVQLPAAFAIRFGFYQPTGGQRLPLLGSVDTTGRARGGRIQLEAGNNQTPVIRWEPEPADPVAAARAARLNTAGKVIDFGPVATNVAFRLRHAGNVWELIPLPSSPSFKVELRLDRLGANGRKVQSVTAVDIDGKTINEATFRQDGQVVRFDTDGSAFAYRIRLAS